MRSVRLLWLLLLCSCTGLPDDVVPVREFELGRYLGTWYEIARLDHSFERGLSNVTAEYSLRADGGVKVVNRGYSRKDDQWRSAEGKAYFVGSERQGHLKVAFFWPFYASYVVFGLDKDYQYAFVAGYDHSFLWLLSRTAEVSATVAERFVDEARSRGFDTEQLIWVEQHITGNPGAG